MRAKTILYGIGTYYNSHKHLLPDEIEIIAYGNSAPEKATSYTGAGIGGVPVLSLDEISESEYDLIYICTDHYLSGTIFDSFKGKKVPPQKIRFLCREDEILFPGYQKCKWDYSIEDDYTIVNAFNDIIVLEREGSDHEVVAEVFSKGIYNFATKENTVVVDMGMNIGAATLFFAGQPNVVKVYGYEPFPDTFSLAKNNIQRNPKHITEKIQIEQIALGRENKEEYVSVVSELTGMRNIYNHKSNYPKVKIKIRAISEVLNEIIKLNPGKSIALKIDVEGAEFEIFDALESDNVFDNIDAIVMEYHGFAGRLFSILQSNGFRWHIYGWANQGIVFAVK